MKRILLASLLLFGFAAMAAAQTPTADEILKAADDVVNAPLNMNLRSTMTVIDKDGYEKIREIAIWQKGEMRMVKFAKPASERGIALLSTDSTTNYVYLPAYKKVRRVAAHVRNQTFMGTDFSQEDMAITRYADDFIPELTGETETHWTLTLTRKEGSAMSYPKLILVTLKEIGGVEQVEYFDSKGDLLKTERRENYRQYEGAYWFPTNVVMTSARDSHKTYLVNSGQKFDLDLPEDYFSQRTLKRPLR